jgi:type IV pilus assembly protein PilC
VLYDILNRIRQGSRISESFAIYKRMFPDIYISMVRAAEASGELAKILNQLAGYMESAQRVKQKVKAAMTYPTLATIMILVVASVLMLVVVPKFAEIFSLIKDDLPLPTKIVLAISNFMRAHFLVAAVLVAGAIALFIVVLKTKRGRYCFDLFKLKVPVFGKLFSQVAIARFSRTLSTLLSSGVPILDALSIVQQASGNAVIELAVSESIGSVSSGSSLAEVFKTRTVFPPMLVKMIAVGEQTGQLDNLLNKIADFYDERVTAAVEGLTAMIEPLLIGVLGLVVGGIVVAIFFPMIKITQSIGK